MNAIPGKALLFDIDGTLTDTDALHLEAFNRVFAPRGQVFDHARFTRELQGFSLASIKARFLADEPTSRQDAIMDHKEAIFRKLASEKIEPLPGLMALLDRADRAHVPMAAITNAPRLNAEMMLSGLGITHRFKAIVIGDELSHGKPHPLPYLEGLRATGGIAGLSIAFEDSRSGVQSASAAGIATVGMRTGLGHDDLVAAGAVTTASDFASPELLDMLSEKMGW
jgi:HAD superfamily hydrolase (TIGR01509 family)